MCRIAGHEGEGCTRREIGRFYVRYSPSTITKTGEVERWDGSHAGEKWIAWS